MQFNQPAIHIDKTTSEKIWDAVGYTFYIGTIVYLLSVWNDLPNQVPAHYNVIGMVDRWGSKWELFILPGTGLFIILFMHLAWKYPHLHNYPKRLNDSNRKAFYRQSRQLINQLKNISLIIFSLILITTINGALGNTAGLSPWFIVMIILGMFMPIIYYLLKVRQIK